MISCNIDFALQRELATRRHRRSRRHRTEARYRTISHDRTVDQPHEFLGCNDFLGQGSTTLAKKIETASHDEHRRVHAREITRLRHMRAVVSIFLARVVAYQIMLIYWVCDAILVRTLTHIYWVCDAILVRTLIACGSP